MISRLRPPYSLSDLLVSLTVRGSDSEECFERAFAERFGFPFGLFFPYGRSGLYTLLRVLGWQNEEVLVPAYTCVVVPHAITLSGNRIQFVDCESDHFNVAPNRYESSVHPSVKMVIPTPLFGYPVNRKGYESSWREKAPDVFVFYDVAHGFGVEDRDGFQVNGADAALFGLGIGKILSTFNGGMLLLRDKNLYEEVRKYRNGSFRSHGMARSISKWIYGFSSWAAFREPLLSFVDYLERTTTLLYSFTEYYYGKSGPSLPRDALTRPQHIQSRMGILQLDRYEHIIARRRTISLLYEKLLSEAGFTLFSYDYTPTYSHFPLAVGDRQSVVEHMRRFGIQLGSLIDYACPDLPGYELFRGSCPNASRFARGMINLPNWYGMGESQVIRVCDLLKRCREKAPTMFEVPS